MLRRDRHAKPNAPSAEQLRGAVSGLISALDAGGTELPAQEVAASEKVLTKAAERLDIAGGNTIVALAGATGSGKSSLFNRIVGSAVATVGMLRPTTTTISSAVWGEEPATELLDWVGSASRHRVSPQRAERSGNAEDLDGLVLLDLPDVDSYRTAHRAEADRVLALTDIFVWVTDPQKYADGVLHEQYIAKARAHQAVTLVVLNQADRLSPEDAQACKAHLQQLLAADGLPGAEVLLVSAKTGLGMDELRSALAAAARAATAARVRLLGDVVQRAQALRGHVADSEPQVPADPDPDLVAALARTAGVPVVLGSVEKDYRRQAAARTGWPFTRWLRGARPDPLRRLRLSSGATKKKSGVNDAELGAIVARSSLPAATPAARAAVTTLTRRLGAKASAGLPPLWVEAIEKAAGPEEDDLADALDQAIVGTPLQDRRPMWWSAVGVLQWVLALTALAGLLWLLVLWGLSALQIPLPDTPFYYGVPAPTGLLFGGLVAGLVLALLCAPLAAFGARRRRKKIERRLHNAIEQVAKNRLLAPQREILSRHRQTREYLDSVRTTI